MSQQTQQETPWAEESAFEAPSKPNGKATHAEAAPSMFAPVSKKIADAAKQGDTSNSRTGKGKQVTFEFSKPPKNLYIKVHPSPSYHIHGLACYRNEVTNTMHYISPELFASNDLPERFKNSCKIINVFTSGVADGTYFLWYINVSSSVWFKAAMKSVELARNTFGIVSTIRARNTYSFEPATEAIPEPNWASLPAFEQLLLGAFDSVISVPDDKVITDFMSGGIANRQDDEE